MSPRPLLALAFVLGAVGGCFLSPNVPPSFRYNCAVDDDCRVLTCLGDLMAIPAAEAAGLTLAEDCDDIPDDEQSQYYEARQVCLGGLCEYPCEITADACPADKGHSLCFNGACTTACGQDVERFPDPDSTCSSPQSCMIIGDDIEIALIEGLIPSGGGAPASPFGGGGGGLSIEDLVGTGVCGVRCDDPGALACPPGQYCSGAMCLPNCAHEDATPCTSGRQCFAYGEFSSCLQVCDAGAAETTCGEGDICVAGLDICLPTCLGEEAIRCGEGRVCEPDLGICVPEAAEDPTGTGTTG